MKINTALNDPLVDLQQWMHVQPFVAWRRPNEERQHGFKACVEPMSVGAFPTQSAFIFAPFNPKMGFPSLVFRPKALDSNEKTDTLDGFIPKIFPKDLPDNEATYCQRIQLLTAAMRRTPFHKCVLSRRVDLDEPEELMAPELFVQLCEHYPSAYVSLVHIPGLFTWLGATPERLLRIKDGEGHTTALAATRRFEGILPELSDWNEKERNEQQLVTDFIVETLSQLEVQNVMVNGPYSSQAANLVHLKTDVQFSAPSGTDFRTLVNALHPTPAVCGLPRETALSSITVSEPHNREYYAGFLGNVAQDELELFVNLRCMRWMEGRPSLFVGGGITAGSVPEQEWEETNFKAHTLLDVIEKICTLAGKNPNAQ